MFKSKKSKEIPSGQEHRTCKACGAALARDTRGKYCADCRKCREDKCNKIIGGIVAGGAVIAVTAKKCVPLVKKYGPAIIKRFTKL